MSEAGTLSSTRSRSRSYLKEWSPIPRLERDQLHLYSYPE